MNSKAAGARKRHFAAATGLAKPDRLVLFPSRLGWMGMIGSGRAVKCLTFGHRSSEAAAAAVPAELIRDARRGIWNRSLVRRLQDYACGVCDDFCDVEVDSGPGTDFQRRVLQCCRGIPYGETLTYGQLAAKAGFAGAARAVGNCMAANRVPLVIPCHRVVAAHGGLGGYSAVGGLRVKRYLLDLEAGRPAKWQNRP